MPIDGDITANKVDVQGVIPISRTVTTPGIYVQVGNFIVGRVQTITENQARGATPIFEVGSVGPIDMTMGQPSYTLAITKMKIYRQSLTQVLSIQSMQTTTVQNSSISDGKTLYGKLYNALTTGAAKVPDAAVFRNLSHFAFPFDIKVIEVDPQTNKRDITIYQGCVLTAYSRPMNATGGLTIAETANATCLNILYQDQDTNTWTA